MHRVATPPNRPVLIYDGDCEFCLRWVRRWQRACGASVDFVALQDQQVARRFPELPRLDLEESVHLVDTEGRILRGAAAVLRSRCLGNGPRWPWRCYEILPGCERFSEWCYRLVARHRRFWSRLTR